MCRTPRFTFSTPVILPWTQQQMKSLRWSETFSVLHVECCHVLKTTMKAIEGYFLISPDDLHWRPSNLMKIPNADFLERTGSENLSARLWRLPPKSANTLHRHIRAEEFLFRAGRHGPPARGRRDVGRAAVRRRAGRPGPVAPGVQRHRRRGALA